MAYSTLYDYYTAQGQSLPSLSTRSQLYQSAGLGSASNYTGTAAQNTQLLNSLQSSSKTSLPQATAPTTAGTAVNSANFSLPSIRPTSGNTDPINGLTSYYNNLFTTQDKMAQDAMAQANKLQEQNKTGLATLLSSVKSPDQARTEAWQQTGINPADYFADQKAKVAEIDQLNKDYNGVVASRDQQIAETKDKLGSNNFINNQVAQIERNAAPRLNEMSANINSKAAVLQAEQGQFQEAEKYVAQAVSDATADMKYKFDLFNSFYKMNQDTIDRLDTIYKDSFHTAMGAAEDAWKTSVNEKTQVGDYMIKYPKAGISINDTLPQAQAKIARAGGTAAGVTPTSGGYKFTPTQLNTGSNKAGLDLTTFKALDPVVQNFFVSTSPTNIKQITSSLSLPNAATLIDQSNLPTQVKTYLKTKIKSTTTTSSGGFLSNIWNSITSFFSR